MLCQTSSDGLRARVLARSLKGKGGQAAHGTRQFKNGRSSSEAGPQTNLQFRRTWAAMGHHGDKEGTE